MKKAFGYSAEQYAWFGGYPGSASLIEDEYRWKEYILHSLIETTLSKDILMLTRIDKPALMKRLFELGCTYSGQILSYSKIVGQLQDAGNTTTLANYLNLLDSAGLLRGIEKFHQQKVHQRLSSPKWMVQNSALFSVYSGYEFTEARSNPAFWGRCVETAVGAHLMSTCKRENIQLYYWRERNMEVDFVLKKKNKYIGLEVKSGRAQNLKGLQAFKNLVNPQKVLFVGDSGIPWKEFLTVNPSDLFD
jgi:predicted AAA+ superfamily ATPase